MAIGAQNAFVLRQGLRRDRVFVSAAFCSLSDLVLITAGVLGLGLFVRSMPWFLAVMTWGGAAFLAWYGILAGLRAWKPEHLEASEGEAPLTSLQLVGALAAFTFLNPHVYLDTVLLLGGLGARHPDPERMAFILGASTASIVWFFGLAYGARLLAPVFARPGTWRIVDGLIALVMLGLASSLVFAGVTGSLL